MNFRNTHHFILTCFLLGVTFYSRAQNTGAKQPALYKINVADSTFVVEFSTDKLINNLLVTVFDKGGHLIFMDCRYNFTGPYKKSIALQQPVKNGFYLKIANDTEVFEKKLGTD